MLSCKFCDRKAEQNYLLLSCHHICCLACAYNCIDYATRELACCGVPTRVDPLAMQMVVSRKRDSICAWAEHSPHHSRSPKPTRGQRSTSPMQQRQLKGRSPHKGIESPHFVDKREEEMLLEGYNDPQKATLGKQNYMSKLIAHSVQKVNKNSLYERTPAAIKHDALQTKSKQAQLQATSSSFRGPLQAPTRAPGEKPCSCVGTGQTKVQEGYNRIIKKLQVNQQRMKQRLQLHLKAYS